MPKNPPGAPANHPRAKASHVAAPTKKPISPELVISAVLHDWYLLDSSTKEVCSIRVIGNSAIKEGKRDFKKFTTTSIGHRKNAHVVQTQSGSHYELYGKMDRKATVENGFSLKVVEAFKTGFPENWKEVLREDWKRRNGQDQVAISINPDVEEEQAPVSFIPPLHAVKGKPIVLPAAPPPSPVAVNSEVARPSIPLVVPSIAEHQDPHLTFLVQKPAHSSPILQLAGKAVSSPEIYGCVPNVIDKLPAPELDCGSGKKDAREAVDKLFLGENVDVVGVEEDQLASGDGLVGIMTSDFDSVMVKPDSGDDFKHKKNVDLVALDAITGRLFERVSNVSVGVSARPLEFVSSISEQGSTRAMIQEIPDSAVVIRSKILEDKTIRKFNVYLHRKTTPDLAVDDADAQSRNLAPHDEIDNDEDPDGVNVGIMRPATPLRRPQRKCVMHRQAARVGKPQSKQQSSALKPKMSKENLSEDPPTHVSFSPQLVTVHNTKIRGIHEPNSLNMPARGSMKKTRPRLSGTPVRKQILSVMPARKPAYSKTPKKRTAKWFADEVPKASGIVMSDAKRTNVASLLFKNKFSIEDVAPLPAVDWEDEIKLNCEPLSHTDTTRTFRMSTGRNPYHFKRRETFYEPSNAAAASERINFAGYLENEKCGKLKRAGNVKNLVDVVEGTAITDPALFNPFKLAEDDNTDEENSQYFSPQSQFN